MEAEKENSVEFVGIDYGSKLAGTTVLCYRQNEQLVLEQSEKKKDADQFLKLRIKEIKAKQVFIDAPLTLPLVYTNPKAANDFFYRQADRATKAMSPMFLGGLTARAMRLKSEMEKENLIFYETYPSYLVREILKGPKEYNKKNKESLNAFGHLLQEKLPLSNLKIQPTNWHQIDAVLAWWSGWRFQQNQNLVIGDKKEGLIVI